jgi:hypothetical protein
MLGVWHSFILTTITATATLHLCNTLHQTNHKKTHYHFSIGAFTKITVVPNAQAGS